MFFSHVESPQTLGNTVAVRHQSRAAGFTPKKNSTSNAVSFPLFVLVFQTWSLCICLDSIIIHMCACTVKHIEAGILNISGARHVRKHNLKFLP